MKYHIRKPELIPTLAMFVVVAVTLYLGVWQLHRLQEKNHLLATIEAAQAKAPRELISYTPDELTKLEWHNVTASGTLLHDKELYATPRYWRGMLGYAVLTPLAIETPTGTQYALINRGWIDPQHKEAVKRPTGNPAGKVVVEGAVRSGFRQGRFTPDNKPADNMWFWYDLPAMAKQTGLPLLPVLIDASAVRMEDGSAIKEGPIPFTIEINIRNDHMGYALTWFMIGLAAIGVFLAYYAKKKET